MTKKKLRYALIGASGYIAPRHMQAIKDNNGILVAAFDPNDSVGIIDSYFPYARFFTEFERFDRHLDKLKRSGTGVDFIIICSPNYLHDAHCRFGLRIGANVICEKPLVLNPWNISSLEEIEKESNGKVYNILQLRLHRSIIDLKKIIVQESESMTKYIVDLTYITSRGQWYSSSWKGDANKSGGIATNIGVHFFDMLSYLFGSVQKSIVHVHKPSVAAGYIEFKKADVKWFLSINSENLPDQVLNEGQRTYRSITINGKEIEFSDGFTELHTISYREILEGRGFDCNEVKTAIDLVHKIRTSEPIGLVGNYHPFLDNINLKDD